MEMSVSLLSSYSLALAEKGHKRALLPLLSESRALHLFCPVRSLENSDMNVGENIFFTTIGERHQGIWNIYTRHP